MAIIGGLAALVGTGFQIAQGIEQSNLAEDQRKREAALQNRAETREKKAGRDEKQKRRAIDLQREREASIATRRKTENSLGQGLLGSSQGAGSTLGQS